MAADNRAAIQEQLKAIYAYRGTELYGHFIKLLQLVDGEYSDDLRKVKPEDLGIKQGASRQLRLLEETLIKQTTGDIPKL